MSSNRRITIIIVTIITLLTGVLAIFIAWRLQQEQAPEVGEAATEEGGSSDQCSQFSQEGCKGVAPSSTCIPQTELMGSDGLRVCYYVSGGSTPTPTCGDGTCNGSETSSSCPSDCQAATTYTCYQCHSGASYCESYTSATPCTTNCNNCSGGGGTPTGGGSEGTSLKECWQSCTADSQCGYNQWGLRLKCVQNKCVNPACAASANNVYCACTGGTCGQLCGPSNNQTLCSGTDVFGSRLACYLFSNPTANGCEFRCMPSLNISQVAIGVCGNTANTDYFKTSISSYSQLMTNYCNTTPPPPGTVIIPSTGIEEYWYSVIGALFVLFGLSFIVNRHLYKRKLLTNEGSFI